MSWYAVNGATFIVGAIQQQEQRSIDACSRLHWDLGGFVDDRFSQRLVWNSSIKVSVHGGLTQR
jgi:hypothetical protein